MTIMIVLLLQVALLAGVCVGFHSQSIPNRAISWHQFESVLSMMESPEVEENAIQRRKFLVTSFAAAATCFFSFQQSAMAIPMASIEEFSSILRDSPFSVEVVQFSGPKSETVTVKLLDGTVFGIKDVVESSADPRSPLKIVATCRDANVKTEFVDFKAVLATSPQKRKMYTNERVQKAYELQAAQKERIRLDELDRLAQVEAQEATAKAYEMQAAQKERIRLDELDRLAQVEAQEATAKAEAAATAASAPE